MAKKTYYESKGIAHYISGTAAGGTATSITVPTGATSAFITAEAGAVYYAINAGTASATSGGYIPQDSNSIVLPIENFSTLDIYSTAGTAHITFYRDY